MVTTSPWPKWLAFLVASLIASRVNGDGVRAGNNNQDINKERDLQTSQVAVGAYYYPWYGNDFHKGGGYLREKLNQRPELGEYNDKFSSIIQRHLDWSRLANINLWVTSWWGPNRRADVTTRNSILAHEDLQDHQIALFYETQGRMKRRGSRTWSTYQVESDFQFIADNYFSHSNYYHIDNKPVVFISLSRGLAVRGILDETIALMRRAAASKGYDEIYLVGDHTFGSPPTAASFQPFEVLDAVTNVGVYGPLSSGASYAEQSGVDSYYDKQDSWRSQAQDQDCGFIPSVIPGFNDRGARNNRRHALSRQLSPGAPSGSLFQASLERAIEQVDEKAGNCLMVNSFNQWHQDTQIEPVVGNTATEPVVYTSGLEYQGYGDMYLRMLQQLTTSTTPQPTSSPTSQPTLSPTTLFDETSPTTEPTSSPTAEPTSSPTAEPTSSPTSEPTPSPMSQPTPASVIVVGAGAAGLSAANLLRRNGIRDIIILEASDKIGGRTAKDDSFAGFPLDLGASFVYNYREVRRIVGRKDILQRIPGTGLPMFANYTWYDFLADYIAPKNPSDIVYDCPVDRVNYQGARVEVACGRRAFSANHAIVTVPLPVLKERDILFSPSLPENISSRHPGWMWEGFKVFIEFSNRFYERSFCFRDLDGTNNVCENANGENLFWDNSYLNPQSNKNILAGYILGVPANRYLDMNDERIVREAVIARLDRRYNGQATRSYMKHLVVNWSNKPYIRGSLSSIGADRDGAQNINNKVFLAGEAFPIDGENGWVHSAMDSGKDAARMVLALS